MSISTPSSERVAGRYQLLRPIGSGNMSTVYEAQDTRRGNHIVAVKLLNTSHDDALKEEIFRRETRALSQLEHPNIVSVLDYGWSSPHRCHYLVFQYIPKTLLQEIAAHRSAHDHEWCWPLMRQMADALVHAHSQGIIHRDIKPSNVLIEAPGQPKLVDFGVSLLKYELATGLTVSSFFSIGYAAPEQRRGDQATERSDIFSLGCVFYHMLARSTPPSEGYLTNEHIEALPVFTQIKQILRRMLTLDPSERFSDAVQLRRRLEVTHNLELLPEVYFLVTDRARRDLFDKGFIDETSMNAACAFLLRELGDDEPKAIHLSLDREGMRVYTDTLRILCARDSTLPVIAIKAVHAPYPPQLEQERSVASTSRFLWQVVDLVGANSIPARQHTALGKTLDTLSGRLTTHQVEVQAGRKLGMERRDFTRMWSAVLAYQQERLEKVPRLAYQQLVPTGDTLSFQLKQAAPDVFSWPESAPIAVVDPNKPQAPIFVGHLLEITGRGVRVSRETGDAHRPGQSMERLPSSGFLVLYQQEAKVALDRQQAALSIIRDGGTLNPRLPEVLLDLSLAEFDEPDETIEFFQRDLALDKQRAVRQALAARDLFLLQGPPGTGKTTTLAEIILQILKVKPDARILVASQSNVAVNHILSRLSELRGVGGIEIVRIGREEKIGHGAKIWTLEQRLATWREQVLSRTEAVMGDLKARLRQKHREQKNWRVYPEAFLADLQECQQWLEEIAEQFVELPMTEGEEVLENAAQMTETLALIRETLPEEMRGQARTMVLAEAERLSQIIAAMLSPSVSDTREQALLQLVSRWRKIFGKQEDFAQPLLERANVLAATCLISGGYYLKTQQFDWAIIDEAGRATAPEILVPLVRARRAILVGDERQLPPMLDEDLSREDLTHLGTSKEHLTESLFSVLVAQGREENLPAMQMLTVQHRMHPSIGQLVSSVFYEGKLTHAVEGRDRDHQLPWLERPVIWWSTTKLPKRGETPQGSSYYNRAEIRAISTLLHRMERTYTELGIHREVAVITPYNAQIVELVAELSPESMFWRALSLEISTLDAFQGRDRDIVLYSTVRSNASGQLGFLRDRRRLNVALSRAREALLIVGDISTLERGWAGPEGNPYQELIRYLRTHPTDCLITHLEAEETHG